MLAGADHFDLLAVALFELMQGCQPKTERVAGCLGAPVEEHAHRPIGSSGLERRVVALQVDRGDERDGWIAI
jgi:hypothetical protein